MSSRCFSSSTVLLIPFALSCRESLSPCVFFCFFCLLCVWECAGVGDVWRFVWWGNEGRVGGTDRLYLV